VSDAVFVIDEIHIVLADQSAAALDPKRQVKPGSYQSTNERERLKIIVVANSKSKIQISSVKPKRQHQISPETLRMQ
jgi:hypothetical protein